MIFYHVSLNVQVHYFLQIEFHSTFSVSYKMSKMYVYYYCILIRIV